MLPSAFQQQFHQRWKHLNDPHVRALAWLLDAPGLLDAEAPQWQGRVARLEAASGGTVAWLEALDAAPEALHAWLTPQPPRRLGLYAEKLMAFHLTRQGILVAQGLQVRDAAGTIGEFDFLLRHEGGLLHWEFASKFYLLDAAHGQQSADRFVGPNLADTLGAKLRKIMEQQLKLSQHPAAKAVLPQPVVLAQALVKGWLFYRGHTPQPTGVPGVASAHCRGFWRPLAELEEVEGERFLILPRLQWLAPVKTRGESLDRTQLVAGLRERFATEAMPALVAVLQQEGSDWFEADRGFIVPDDWEARAARARAVS